MKYLSTGLSAYVVTAILFRVAPDPFNMMIFFWMLIGYSKIRVQDSFIGCLTVWLISPFWPLYMRKRN